MSAPVSIEYVNRWKLDPNGDCQMETPSFSPALDLEFCFKYTWEWDTHSPYKTILKLQLVKLKGLETSAPLSMNVLVNIFYSNGELYNAYRKQTSNNIYQMDEISFGAMTIRKSENGFVLQCCLRISNDTSKASPPSSTSCTNNNHKLFMGNFKSIYESCPFSDVQFIIDEKTLSAHKVILAAHSPVFARMLTDNFNESSTITIKDSSCEVFSSFLKALYSGEILDKLWSNVKELYVLANKYDVAILKHECQQIIPSLLSMDTVCDILIMAYTFDDACLKMAAKDYTITKLKSIITSNKWTALMRSHPHIGYEVTSNFISST